MAGESRPTGIDDLGEPESFVAKGWGAFEKRELAMVRVTLRRHHAVSSTGTPCRRSL
jgi:hypothetical protein